MMVWYGLAGALLQLGEQHLAGGHVTLGAVPAQHRKLGGVQDRGAPRQPAWGWAILITVRADPDARDAGQGANRG